MSARKRLSPRGAEAPRGARSMRPAAVACLLAVALAGGGCSHFRKKPPVTTKPEPAVPLRLGRVALVNEEEHFALIETFGIPAPNAGARLRIFQEGGATVDLRATEVRRRPFLVADLVSGRPAKGEIVFQLHPAAPASAPTPAATPAPAPATTPARASWWRRLLPFGVRK